jgi:hypothetical protein
MARIEQEIINDMGTPPSGFVFAQLSEWVAWRGFFAKAIALFESILDRTKSDINTIIATQKMGSKSWYAKKITEFQNGDSLIIDENTGILGYATIDTNKQIIARCSISEENIEGINNVVVKVAKYNNLDDKVLVPLDVSTELPSLETYVEEIKIVGTDTLVVSSAADFVKMIGSVYYDPAHNPDEVVAAVKQNLINYRDTLDFNGVIKRHEFIAAIAKHVGVYSVDIDTFEHRTAVGVYVPLESSVNLFAGYFNYDVGTGFLLVFKNHKTNAVYATITTLI